MNLTTPDKIRNLQRKLYCKAKAEPIFRFYLLYDKICREDILVHAYRLARLNAGAPGVDGMTFARIEKQGLEAWLAGLRAELVSKTYRPDPVRRMMIPKANGGERPLGIPTIRDRVIQTAAKIVIEPIFEADFEDNAYGYRPARGAVDAVKEVHRHLCRGYADVVDADLSKYFDTIPHSELIKSVARRRKSTAGQHLHEPVPEALAFDRMRRHVPCSRRLLCRRLRYPQPRLRGGGISVDEGGDDQARVDDQRGENFVEKRPTGTLRLPRLLVRRASV
jgi:retron-type reverse transcriptase